MKTGKYAKRALFAAATLALTGIIQPPALRAADHGDSPTVGSDQGCDLADLYAFLDPNDNDQVVLIATLRGFIVPSEAGNFGNFDPAMRLRFNIENTGDATPDMFIDVTFSKRLVAEGEASPSQTAKIAFSGKVPSAFAGVKGRFEAAVSQPNLAAMAPPRTTPDDLASMKNPTPGIKFFAGVADDPFFFDIVGFNRFVSSVLAGTPDTTHLARARDSFAGYNVMGVALRIPVGLLRSTKANAGTKIGVNTTAGRKTEHSSKGEKVGVGAYSQVDRQGVPGINVVFIPYNRKNAYNGATTIDDSKGKFTADIAKTLTDLGTDATNIGILAGVAGIPLTPNPPKADRTTGDYLRLETDKALMPNPAMGGETAGGGFDATNGFPLNGRRLRDDVIDTVLFYVLNQPAINPGDGVNASEELNLNVFPFLPLPHQPFANGVLDDKTRN